MSSPATSPDPPPLRLALIGAGAMGANYVKAVQPLSAVRLVAVVDEVLARAHEVAAAIGAAAATSLRDAGDVDGVIVAVPSAVHRAVAEPLLSAGVHCLVEKPFALTEIDCRALMAAAAAGNACLQVGHVERFNAAVQALLQAGPPASEIRGITARRMNSGSARVTDIDVVLDLMVHDIDVVMALKRSPVEAVRATGTKDHALAELVFSDGTRAHLTASRVTQGRTRDLRIEMKGGAVYALDYINRTLTKNGASVAVPGDGNNLGRQMTSFAHAIRTGAPPHISGKDALAVMDVVWRVQRELGI